jgi:uncharacterized protein YegL
MNPNLLSAQHSAAHFCLALLEGTGVQVRFGGSTPCHVPSTKTIWLPPYSQFDPKHLDDEAIARKQDFLLSVYRVLALHEHGHPLYTDPDPDTRNPGDLGGHLWNSLEDVRIDNISQSRFAGARAMYNDGYSALSKIGYWGPTEDDATVVCAFGNWVLYRARAEICGQTCFQPFAVQTEDLLRSLAGDDLVDRAWAIIAPVRLARSTKDVFDIVERLLALLRELSKPKPDQPKADQPTPEQQPQSGDTPPGDPSGDPAKTPPSGDSGSGKDDSKSNLGDGPKPPPNGSDPSTPGDSPSDAPSGSPSGSPSDAPSGSPSDAPHGASAGGPATSGDVGDNPAAKILAATTDDLPADVGAVIANAFAIASSVAAANGARTVSFPGLKPACMSAFQSSVHQDTRGLSIRLRRLLETQTREDIQYSRRGSQIDPALLTRVPFGEREVFFEETVVRRPDTAVMLVLDRSPSMKGRRIEVCREAALRCSLALAQVPGIAVGAQSFPLVTDHSKSDVLELLPIGKNPRQYAGNFANLEAARYGGTPLAEALTRARYALLSRREPRRLIFVLTDGDPDGHGSRETDILELLRRDRIEVVGLGILSMAVQNLFRRSEVINDVESLEPALLRLLSNTLMKTAA